MNKTKNMKRGTALVLAAAFTMMVFLAPAASADSQNTSGTTTSIWNWSTGAVQRTQSHSGDDIAFDQASGNDIEMRWVKCSDLSVYGASVHTTWSAGYYNIGTNFAAGTCFKLQFRGWVSTGGFTGIVYWNYSWV